MTLSPSQPQITARYTWAEIWTAVLTRPSVGTFQEILRDPAVSRRRAYTWMLVTWLITIVFLFVLMPTDIEALRAQLPPDMDISNSSLQSTMMMSMMCAVPLVLLIAMGMFRLMTWFVQIVARVMGGKVKTDSSTEITYTFAAIQAPLNIISLLFLVLPANPILGVISLAATVYQFGLMVMAVRTVYDLSWGRAILPVVSFVSILLLTLVGVGMMM
jgi:hypothetical protein